MNNSTSTTSASTEMRPRKVGLLYTVTNKETKDETDKIKDPSTKTPMSSHPKGVLQRQQEKFRMHQLFWPRVKPHEASTFLVTKRISVDHMIMSFLFLLISLNPRNPKTLLGLISNSSDFELAASIGRGAAARGHAKDPAIALLAWLLDRGSGFSLQSLRFRVQGSGSTWRFMGSYKWVISPLTWVIIQYGL